LHEISENKPAEREEGVLVSYAVMLAKFQGKGALL